MEKLCSVAMGLSAGQPVLLFSTNHEGLKANGSSKSIPLTRKTTQGKRSRGQELRKTVPESPLSSMVMRGVVPREMRRKDVPAGQPHAYLRVDA